ncbi:MAG: tetratricopeptide repeat protein [Clostridia bacterium]|nr:tetratricopeptide repeat protein [Clostridia bacterium]
MICFNCGVKLAGNEYKECQVCGVKLAGVCTSCQHPNPRMGKFCFYCGSKLTVAEESSVQNFDTLSEARRKVAVIFADVSGFTALSEKMDPEEVREIINECFHYITKPVYELEGTIDKYMGDCVMILFGAKYAHSDDAKRAVICAIRMLELVREFSEERLSKKGYSLTLSIGINYGLVVTGSVGNYFDRDYTVMGDIVNTAQRLQSNAQKGTILVSESVFFETNDLIHYSDAREIAVKNKEKPVRCYSPVHLGYEYSFEKNMLFVERDEEILNLHSAYNHAMNTGARYLTVTGEAGIGKTRLLKEFFLKLDNGIKKVWVDLGPVSQNRAYYMISNILMGIMNINMEDGKRVKQNRLLSFLDYIMASRSDEEIRRNYNFIGLILGLDRDHEFQNILNAMTVESVRREILRQLSVFFTSYCKKHRTVVVVDDVHWCDGNSINLIKDIAGHLLHTPIAFIFSSRYEIEELSAIGETLRVNMLSRRGVLQLTCDILGCKDVDSNLLDMVHKFTKGNPMYVREYAANIKKTGKYYLKSNTAYIEEREIGTLPASIQSLILANMAELDDVTKSFLQAASAVGKDFSLSLVKGILDFPMDEESILKLPLQLEIVSKKSVYTQEGLVERVFTFNQDTEREVIYDSILNKTKRDLHRKIGEYIEARYQKDIEGYYEILCSHFYRAGLIKKAEDYYYKTALKLKDGFNLSTSLEYYSQFLEMVKNSRDEEGDLRVVHALKDMGYIHFITGDYAKALEYLNMALGCANLMDDIYTLKIMFAEVYKEQDAFDEAMAILDEIEAKIKTDHNIYGKLLQLKCSILRIMGDARAISLAKKSETILLKTKDYDNLSETMNQAGIAYFTKGVIDEALFYLNKSYKYAEKVNNLAVMAKVSGNLGIIYYSTGMVSKAFESFVKSIDISKKISDAQGFIAGNINLGVLYLDKGLFDRAEHLFKESLELSREISQGLNECVNLTNLGDVMFERGLYQEALEYFKKSLEIAQNIGVPIGEGINYIGISKVYLKLGTLETVLGMLEIAGEIFKNVDGLEYLSDYYRYKSILAFTQDENDQALKLCDQAIDVSVQNQNDHRRLKALRLKGNILAKAGARDKALELYSESIRLSEQLESEYEAAKGYFNRAVTNEGMQNFEEAKKDLLRAKECIGKVDQCRWTEIIGGCKIGSP